MFETLEKRATGLCIATVIGIIFVGKMFGGSLWGLIPLASIISSGTFLWMKEVIRSGREMEWSSEQLRGETVRFLPFRIDVYLWVLLTFSRQRQTCYRSLSSG